MPIDSKKRTFLTSYSKKTAFFMPLYKFFSYFCIVILTKQSFYLKELIP